MTQYDVLILFSGGADSRLLLELALAMRKKVFCMLVDYKQIHAQELISAGKQLGENNVRFSIPYRVIDIGNLGATSALTSGDKNLYSGVSEWYIPGRNLILVSLAYSLAESMNISEIWFGADYSDRVGLFPDCYQEWVLKVNELLEINGSKKIKLVAPLLGFSKEYVISCLQEIFQVEMDEVFSGYGQ